jgi:hypothetical protein
MIRILLFATPFLFLVGCSGGSDSTSTSNAETTVCQDVQGITVPDAQEIIDEAVSNVPEVSSESPSVITGGSAPAPSTGLGGQATPTGKDNGVVVVQCGGTYIETETQTVVDNDTTESSKQKKDAIVAAIRSGAVTTIIVRDSDNL